MIPFECPRGVSDDSVEIVMHYDLPLDSARIEILPDLAISQAISSTLFCLDDLQQLEPALVDSWDVEGRRLFLHLKDSARWSDGTTISAKDIIESFAGLKKLYGTRLKAFFDEYTNLTIEDDRTVCFHLALSVHPEGFMLRLADPMYCVCKRDVEGVFQSDITSGAYSVYPHTPQSECLHLHLNEHWFERSSEMVEHIHLSRKKAEDALRAKTYFDICEIPGVLGDEEERHFLDSGMKIWRQNLNRVVFLSLSSRLANSAGFALLRHLSTEFRRADIVHGFSAAVPYRQFFPPGDILHSPRYDGSVAPVSPENFATTLERPLRILCRVREGLRSNLEREMTRVLKIAPTWVSCSETDNVYSKWLEGDYDLYFGGLAIGDPNPEGTIGYLFEWDHALVPSGNTDFLDRLGRARSAPAAEALEAYRDVVSEATFHGHVLPLFHCPSSIVAQRRIDLSLVPKTDEAMRLSRIRVRTGHPEETCQPGHPERSLSDGHISRKALSNKG